MSPAPRIDGSWPAAAHRHVQAKPRVWPFFLTLALVFVVTQLAGLVLIGVLARRAGATPSNVTPRHVAIVLTNPSTFIVSSMISGGLLFLAVGVAGGIPGVDLRMRAARISALRVFPLIAGAIAVATLVSLFLDALATHGIVARTLLLTRRALTDISGNTLAAALLTIGLISGAAEEMFFRGFVQTRLTVRWGSAVAVLVTSAAFGIFHIEPLYILVAFILGLYLGWMTEVSGSIIPAIVAHVLNNTFSVYEAAYDVSLSGDTKFLLGIVCVIVIPVVVLNAGKVMPSTHAERAQRAWPTSTGARPASAGAGASGTTAPEPGAVARSSGPGPERRVPISAPQAKDAAELRFVVRRIELAPDGLRVTSLRGRISTVPWIEIEELVIRRLPPDTPWNSQIMSDIAVRGAGTRVVRMIHTTQVTFGLLPAGASTSRLDNVRALGAHLVAQNPAIALDPETDAFIRSGAPVARFVTMSQFAEYDMRYG
jgi:membrane protease YdiL (CAAX protease family)